MRPRRIATFAWLATLGAASLPPHRLAAQATVSPATIERSAPLRATVWTTAAGGATRYRRVTGRLLRLDADSLLLARDHDVLAIARANLARLETADPTRSRGRSALSAAGKLGGVGLVGGALFGWTTWEPCEGDWCVSRAGAAALVGGVLGALGASTGAVAGFALHRPRWRRVALEGEARVGLLAAPHGVGLAVRF